MQLNRAWRAQAKAGGLIPSAGASSARRDQAADNDFGRVNTLTILDGAGSGVAAACRVANWAARRRFAGATPQAPVVRAGTDDRSYLHTTKFVIPACSSESKQSFQKGTTALGQRIAQWTDSATIFLERAFALPVELVRPPAAVRAVASAAHSIG